MTAEPYRVPATRPTRQTVAFASGRLSYSKVRAITRVDHPGNESELVESALVTTAAQLDRIVRAMRAATPQQVRDRHRDRALTWWWDDDGMLRISVRLDPEEGAAALAALRAACSAQPHPTADGTPAAQRRERSPGDGPQRKSADRPHAAAASGTAAPAAVAEFVARPRTVRVSARPRAAEATRGSSAVEVSAKPPAVEGTTELTAVTFARSAEVADVTGPPTAEAVAGTHAAGTAASEKTTSTAGFGGARSDPHLGIDARTRGEWSSAGPVSASAEAPASVPPYQEAKTSLADAFGAIMRSYLGSVARDTTEPDAFQVVVLTQITGTADADAASSPGGETATWARGEGRQYGSTAPAGSGSPVRTAG